MAEMQGFTFSVIFVIVFASLLASIPLGLLGPGLTPEQVEGIDPSLITGFKYSADWNTIDYAGAPIASYAYTINSVDWASFYAVTGYFYLGSKALFLGVFWFGQYDYVDFISQDGTNRGGSLTFDEIDEDAVDGATKYNMLYTEYGSSAGSFVVAFNITLYTDSEDAWDNDALLFVHGLGIENTATNNIGSLVVSLLTLSLPNCPVLINIILITPVWSTILYVLWYIIKEMIPFV